MSDKDIISIELTDNMKSALGHLPSHVIAAVSSSLLDLSCILLQTDDIQIEVLDSACKLTIYMQSGVRTLKVNLVSE